MTSFEQEISGVGSDRSTNCATTNAPQQKYFKKDRTELNMEAQEGIKDIERLWVQLLFLTESQLRDRKSGDCRLKPAFRRPWHSGDFINRSFDRSIVRSTLFISLHRHPHSRSFKIIFSKRNFSQFCASIFISSLLDVDEELHNYFKMNGTKLCPLNTVGRRSPSTD